MHLPSGTYGIDEQVWVRSLSDWCCGERSTVRANRAPCSDYVSQPVDTAIAVALILPQGDACLPERSIMVVIGGRGHEHESCSLISCFIPETVLRVESPAPRSGVSETDTISWEKLSEEIWSEPMTVVAR